MFEVLARHAAITDPYDTQKGSTSKIPPRVVAAYQQLPTMLLLHFLS